ncbi:MAG: aminopeptidase [Cytophagales bacterium]|nr:aminopeptidase [Rhizobacter sp.]
MATLGVVGVVVLAIGTVCLTSGCSSLGYYAQAASGHVSLLNKARPVPDWLADDATPQPLRDRLALSQRMRDFAVNELKLPDNASYRRYADLGRPAAVWNVVAAPELSLALQTWCFPVVGCVGYRGYYDRAGADTLATELRTLGMEATVQAIPAYSTLGKLPGDYFSDPLLNTFIRWTEGELARLIFHELAHQVAYASGDTMFNESFATAVERIGGARWLEEQSSPEARAEYVALEQRRQDFRRIAMQARADLDAIYRNPQLGDEAKRLAKRERFERLRAEHVVLKAGAWQGYAGYDAWFANANNASLGVLAAYNELVPQFERLFEREGRDFNRFYAEVKRIAALPPAERRATLGS